jgi:Holliday junction resolvase
MTGTYPEKFTHKELVELGRAWCIKPYAQNAEHGHAGCSVVITEISANTWGMEIPDVLGFCNKASILIECKASRADFLRDKEKVFRSQETENMALGNQRWYLAPLCMIKNEEVPEGWGLLEVHRCRDIMVSIHTKIKEKNWKSEQNILISVLRRLNVANNDHIAIQRGPSSKKRATFYINNEELP